MRRYIVSTVVSDVSKVQGRLVLKLLDHEYEDINISRSARPVTRLRFPEYSNLQHRHGEGILVFFSKKIIVILSLIKR
jgi:hypothetical protein